MNRKNTLGTLLVGALAGLAGCVSTSELEAKAQAVANIGASSITVDSRVYSQQRGVVAIAGMNETTGQTVITEQQFLRVTNSTNENNSMAEIHKYDIEMYDNGIDGTCDAGTLYINDYEQPLYYSKLNETGMENEDFFQSEYEKALSYLSGSYAQARKD